jgi:hypothetical protein
MSQIEVFNLLVNRKMSRKEFYEWVRDIRTSNYNRGYDEGLKDGIPKERYQGEFGARSNY